MEAVAAHGSKYRGTALGVGAMAKSCMWAVRPLDEAGIEPVRLLEMCPGTDMVTRYVGRSYYVLWVEDLETRLLVGRLHGRQAVCTFSVQA